MTTTRPTAKQDADYIFHELTRSTCPECQAVIDAQIIIRSGKVYMRKRCPEHKQHICLALIEVNTACNLNCPVCFANAGIGYSLTLEQVETMLDRFVEIEGDPEVVQFSGGEPTIHPQLPAMIQAAAASWH